MRSSKKLFIFHLTYIGLVTMMIRVKFLYDLGPRNTTKLFQEAGKSTFVAKWTKIFDHQDGDRSKSSKMVKMRFRKMIFNF